MQAQPDLTRLARLISAHAPSDGVFPLPVPGVSAIKVSRPSTAATHVLQHPSVCITAQGAEVVMIGDDIYRYEGGQVAVYSVDIPVAAQVTKASPAEPCVTLRIALDPQRIRGLAAKVFPDGAPPPKDLRALYVGEADAHVIQAGERLMEAMSRPADATRIAPLIVEEVLMRLLRSPIGNRIATMGDPDSSLHRVGRAVAWIREHHAQSIEVAQLAKLVNMSVSTFHRHFRAVTSMSSMQYQKILRLHAARGLMLTSMLDVVAAGRRVGYPSTSHFTREYGRFFGTSPNRDIQRLREQGLAAGESTAAWRRLSR